MRLDQNSTALLILATAGIAAFVIHKFRQGSAVSSRLRDEPAAFSTLPELDGHMPSAEAKAVTVAMGTETNPSNLTAFANTLLPNFPMAAEMLKTKAGVVAPAIVEETLTEQRVRSALLAELETLKGGMA